MFERGGPTPGAAFGRRDVAIHGVLLLLVVAVFGQVVRHSFVLWDDPQYIWLNPVVRGGFSLDAAFRALTLFWSDNWHPLTWWSHMLDMQLFGMWAGGHHLVSVFWHALNTALVFELMRRWGGGRAAAAIIAALFAVHPLHVESVAWAAERKDVLAGFFWLLVVLLYGHWRARPSAGRYGAVTLALICGLMAKPMLVTLPAILLVLDFWPHRRWSFDGGAVAAARALRPLVVEKLPWFALAAATVVLTLAAQTQARAAADALGFGDRLAIALNGLGAYLRLTLWPDGLMFFYPVAAPKALPLLLSALAVAVLTWWAWRARRSQPWVLAGWLWFLLALLPVIGLVKVGTHAYADRYTYLAHIGLFWMLVLSAASLRVRRPAWQPGAALLGALIVGGLAVVAARQTAVWKDGVTLFGHALKVDPEHPVAHLNLAEEYLERSNLAGAETHAARAMQQMPAGELAARLHMVLGNVALRQRNPNAAIAHFRAAIAANRRSALAHYNLGIALAETGDLPGAVTSFEQSLVLRPESSEAQNNLGVVRRRLGDDRAASAAFESALRIDPANTSAAYNLASLRLTAGDAGAARQLLTGILVRDPQHLAARNAMARIDAASAARGGG